MDVVMKVENVAIRYIIGDFKDIGIKEYTMRRMTGNYHVKEFMAVNGVSFELHEGDMLGIIGSNGAGKSTLLKAVAGIMEPTHGKINTNGEVVALLELGSGFDGDLTVKENAYLRGAMLGYTKEFMHSTYDQIIDFAELREFENQPFKQLSSGMKSRLAFSIASLVNPDILILDEVLSVGDGAFQEKSAKKMREIISRGATTILVSHSLSQIRELCNKVLWLDHGRQVAFGETQEICDRYERFLRGECPARMESEAEDVPAVLPEEKKRAEAPKPVKKNHRFCVLISAIVLGIFAAMIAFFSCENISSRKNSFEEVRIYVEELADEVTYRGASTDGIWSNPRETVLDQNGWLHDEAQDVYSAVKDDAALCVRLPVSQNRTLTFNAGPEQGCVRVEFGEQSVMLDLKEPETVELGLAYEIPNTEGIAHSQNMSAWVAVFVFILVSAFSLILGLTCRERIVETNMKNREMWGDFLRVVCCFTIVLLHNTCNVKSEFLDGRVSVLVVNAFTAFAVPCFYMISGAYLLRKPQGIKSVLTKRIPKLYIPLLFWSIGYILLSGDVAPKRFVKMFYQNQTPHFWFIYSMIGIYFLLPLLETLYYRLTKYQKLYLLCLLLIIPGIWSDFGKLTGHELPSLQFALLWPDLGLFFFGAFLYENRDWIQRRKPLEYGFGFLGGITITAVLTAYISFRNGSWYNEFIATIGSAGNLIAAGFMFCLAMRLDKSLNMLPRYMKDKIHLLGELSMGIYFIHVFFNFCVSNGKIELLPLYSNMGSMTAMVGTAFIFFIVSAGICYCGHQIPKLKKLF